MRNTALGFLVALIAWYLFTDRKINDRFLIYIVIFIGFLFSLSLYTGGSQSVPSIFKMALSLVTAYLILKTVGTSFTGTYIKLVVFLAIISLFGYLSDTLHLFDGLVAKLPSVGEMGYEGVFYVFRHAYHPYRNNSIFFEPGAYQAFLNAALFLIFFTKTGFGIRRTWTYIAVLMVALITTFSTQGFVIFSIGFILFLYKSEILPFSGKAILVGLIFSIVIVFSSLFYSTFVVKLSAYLEPEEGLRGHSAHVRSYDAQADLEIFKKHVFGLGHEKYTEEFRAINRNIGIVSVEEDLGARSSNGVTRSLAMYGLPYSLFIFGSYYWALRKLLYDLLLTGTAFIMFMLFMIGEVSYTVLPISFAIIAAAFVFDRTSGKKLETELV